MLCLSDQLPLSHALWPAWAWSHTSVSAWAISCFWSCLCAQHYRFLVKRLLKMMLEFLQFINESYTKMLSIEPLRYWIIRWIGFPDLYNHSKFAQHMIFSSPKLILKKGVVGGWLHYLVKTKCGMEHGMNHPQKSLCLQKLTFKLSFYFCWNGRHWWHTIYRQVTYPVLEDGYAFWCD